MFAGVFELFSCISLDEAYPPACTCCKPRIDAGAEDVTASAADGPRGSAEWGMLNAE
jgi:hypothetical protein